MEGVVVEEIEPLVGTEKGTVDDKGRLLFAKKKREVLGEDFTIAIGTVGYLALYPKKVWNRLVNTILEHDITNPGREIYTRLVCGQAESSLKFDQQGRLVLPQWLREKARIREKTDVVIIGCGDHAEIWSSDEYERYLDDPEGYGLKRREQLVNARRLMKEWE